MLRTSPHCCGFAEPGPPMWPPRSPLGLFSRPNIRFHSICSVARSLPPKCIGSAPSGPRNCRNWARYPRKRTWKDGKEQNPCPTANTSRSNSKACVELHDYLSRQPPNKQNNRTAWNLQVLTWARQSRVPGLQTRRAIACNPIITAHLPSLSFVKNWILRR